MEQYTVSARKFRPDSFDKVVGQQHVTNTLKNALLNHCLAQAFLFCGPRGVGKTTCARILAKAINCAQLTPQGEPCNNCSACLRAQIKEGGSIFELDAASNNSVDDVRMLVEQVRYVPQADKYKVYIVDEVHMLSTSAFNAFLKTLEEPPKHAVFILATTEKHKIIPTILSRCQIFDFRRVRTVDIVDHLTHIAQARKITYEIEALHIIAEKADGALRDALSLLDMVASFEVNRNITYKSVIENLHIIDYEYFFSIIKNCSENDVKNCFIQFNSILEQGFDGQNFISGLSSHLRNLLVCKYDATIEVLLDASKGITDLYKNQATTLTIDFILNALNIIMKYDLQYKNSYNKRLIVEMMLLSLATIDKDIPVQNIIDTKATVLYNDAIKKPTQVIEKHSVKETLDKVDKNNTDKIEQAEKIEQKKESTKNIPPYPPNISPTLQPLKLQRTMSTTKIPNLSSIQPKQDSLNPITSSTATDIKHNEVQKNIQELNHQAAIEKLIDIYANRFHDSGNMAEYNTLCSKKEILGTRIDFIFRNTIQVALLNEIKSDLISFLSKELQINEIQINGLLEEENFEKKPYTDREKLNSFVYKFPIIEDLIDKFALTLD